MDHSNVWATVLAGGEGTRVRGFLQEVCGGSGLKQFSTVIGSRSMLRCTLDRITRLIPPERVLVVVSATSRRCRKTACGLASAKCHLSTQEPRHRARHSPATCAHHQSRPLGDRGRVSIRSFHPR